MGLSFFAAQRSWLDLPPHSSCLSSWTNSCEIAFLRRGRGSDELTEAMKWWSEAKQVSTALESLRAVHQGGLSWETRAQQGRAVRRKCCVLGDYSRNSMSNVFATEGSCLLHPLSTTTLIFSVDPVFLHGQQSNGIHLGNKLLPHWNRYEFYP